MRYRAFLLVLPVMALLHSAPAAGQTRGVPTLEQLPRIAIDTVETADPDTKIVLYTNNTWSYHRPAMERYDDTEVYEQHWDTTQVFAYRSVELADLPPTVELRLISAMSDFHYPTIGRVFSRYGPRGRRNHNGVDIPLKTGDPIYATFEGRVRYARYNSGGFGNLVIIRHPNGLETWYAHLVRGNVRTNEYVKAGQVIGFAGSTGRSRSTHLHYEMRYCDQTFDPEFLVDFATGQLRYQTFALEKSFFNIRSRATDQLEEEDDFENIAFAGGEDGELTSEQIVNSISNGQRTVAAATGNAVYHTIRQGDILGRIAQRYGVSIDQICRLNNITRTTTIYPGKSLRIR